MTINLKSEIEIELKVDVQVQVLRLVDENSKVESNFLSKWVVGLFVSLILDVVF